MGSFILLLLLMLLTCGFGVVRMIDPVEPPRWLRLLTRTLLLLLGAVVLLLVCAFWAMG